MKKYYATFTGKLVGAIGCSERFVDIPVIADNEDQALLNLYQGYDHIFNCNFKLDSEVGVVDSRYSEGIYICFYINPKSSFGFHLQKGLKVDSPQNLIKDQKERELVMLEAQVYASMINDEPEFKKGDLVTFRAYEDQNIPAKILEVIKPNINSPLFREKYFYSYKVCGADKIPLVSHTSGLSIKESKWFKCPIKYPFKF